MKQDGKIMIGLPNSAKLSYDIYFKDHLSHITPDNLRTIFYVNKLRTTKCIISRKYINNFQCGIGEIGRLAKNGKAQGKYISKEGYSFKDSYNYYNNTFTFINKCIKNNECTYNTGKLSKLLMSFGKKTHKIG